MAFPEVVIYDVGFTLSLPTSPSATSSTNAIAHDAQSSNLLVDLIDEKGIRSLVRSLPIIVGNPQDCGAQRRPVWCIVLHDVPWFHRHELAPKVMPRPWRHVQPPTRRDAYSHPPARLNLQRAIPQTLAKLASVLGHQDAVEGLNAVLAMLRVPKGLKEIGMPGDGIDKASDLAVENIYWNLRPLEREFLRGITGRAWVGEPARKDI